MPSDQLPARTNHDLTTMPIIDAIEAYTPQFADALPENIPLQRFKRTVLTALNQNPDLAKCDRRSLFLACVKCAQDGLYPDGREAALVPYEGQVSYLPMIAGIRKRMRNSGEVLSAIAEVVYEKDHFRQVKGEHQTIEHEPPPLDQDRGKPVGAYAIIKLTNGETLREVMSLRELERVRAFSKAKKPAAPWNTWTEEMYRKTVLRRCSKGAPVSSENLAVLLARDDEDQEALPPPPPPPRREDYEPNEPKEPRFFVIDCDGEPYEFHTKDNAERALEAVFVEAARRGQAAVDAAYENNGGEFPYARELYEMYSSQDPGSSNPPDARESVVPADVTPAVAPEQSHPKPAATDDPILPGPLRVPIEGSGGGGGKDSRVAWLKDGAIEEFSKQQNPADGPPARAPRASPQTRDAGPPASPPEGAPTLPGSRVTPLSDEIPMPLRNGREDPVTWFHALFIRRAEKIGNIEDLAWLIGNNERHIQAYMASVKPEDADAARKRIEYLKSVLMP